MIAAALAMPHPESPRISRHPSLRNRLLARVLLPGAILALLLAAVGSGLIRDAVEVAHDRTLDGSVQVIAERVAVDDDDEIAVDLPPVALGMLENNAEDQIYYSVSYEGGIVSGYPDLVQANAARNMPGLIVHIDTTMRGARIRLAAQAKRVYGRPGLFLVEVAETCNARRALETRLLVPLGSLGVGLLALVWILASVGISRSLAPLTGLSDEIDRRVARRIVILDPLATEDVPREALAPVLAFNTLLYRLDHMTGVLRRFTADASHQMRTPLAVMQMQLDLLRRAGAPNVPFSPLAEMEQALGRLGHLFEQLIRLARAEQEGLQPTSLVPIDLIAVLGELLAERAPTAFALGQNVEFEHYERRVMVLADPILVTELFANLIDNAIKYNRPGGSVVLRLGVEAGRGFAMVEDEGHGIPPAERTRVFERFYQIARPGAHASAGDGRVEGSGLGLAIVSSLASRLKASVTLGDRPGSSGLRVTVEFPASFDAPHLD